MKKIKLCFCIFFLFCGFICGSELNILQQESGPWKTNSYLVFDESGREAALVDPGWPIETLLEGIIKKNLKLKYILITHCHQDHIAGVPEVFERYPEVKLVYSREEERAIPFYSNWRSLYIKSSVDAYERSEEIVALMDFDYNQLKKPDIYAEDGQKFRLGNTIIGTLPTPGHSEGSVTYFTEGAVFSGDLIFYNIIGFIDYKFGSRGGLIDSVKNLLLRFSDDTVLYPGHGPVSSIGYEKENNKSIPHK